MTSQREPRPPSEQGDNGEEVLVDDGEGPAEAARRQADVVARSRARSTEDPPPRHEGERQPD